MYILYPVEYGCVLLQTRFACFCKWREHQTISSFYSNPFPEHPIVWMSAPNILFRFFQICFVYFGSASMTTLEISHTYLKQRHTYVTLSTARWLRLFDSSAQWHYGYLWCEFAILIAIRWRCPSTNQASHCSQSLALCYHEWTSTRTDPTTLYLGTHYGYKNKVQPWALLLPLRFPLYTLPKLKTPYIYHISAIWSRITNGISIMVSWSFETTTKIPVQSMDFWHYTQNWPKWNSLGRRIISQFLFWT
jgi:hypothetical protein